MCSRDKTFNDMCLNLIWHSMLDNVAANATTRQTLNQKQFAQKKIMKIFVDFTAQKQVICLIQIG